MTTAAEPKSLIPQPPEIQEFLKCACAHCGHVIEYLSKNANNIVECPRCREKSRLPERQKLSLVESHGPPIPSTKICPVCGEARRFSEHTCGHCDARERRKNISKWTIMSVLFVSVVGGAWFAAHRHNAPLQKELAAKKASFMILEQPVVTRPKALSDLVPQKFWLEQKRGSDFAMVVGDVLNNSGNTHYRMKLELLLVDATGAMVGKVTDDSAQLGPRQSWHVVIPVNNPKAKNVKFGSIKENQ